MENVKQFTQKIWDLREDMNKFLEIDENDRHIILTIEKLFISSLSSEDDFDKNTYTSIILFVVKNDEEKYNRFIDYLKIFEEIINFVKENGKR